MNEGYIQFACIIANLQKRKTIYKEYDTLYKYSIIKKARDVMVTLDHLQQIKDKKDAIYKEVHKYCCNNLNPQCSLADGFDNDVFAAAMACLNDGIERADVIIDKLHLKMSKLGLPVGQGVKKLRAFVAVKRLELEDIEDKIDNFMAQLIVNKLPFAICKYHASKDLDPLEILLLDKRSEFGKHTTAKNIVRYFEMVMKTVDKLNVCRQCGKNNLSNKKQFRVCKLCNRIAFCSSACHIKSLKSNIHGHSVECRAIRI